MIFRSDASYLSRGSSGVVRSLLYVANATANTSAGQQHMAPPPDALVAVASSGGDSGVSVLSPRGRYVCMRGVWKPNRASSPTRTACIVLLGIAPASRESMQHARPVDNARCRRSSRRRRSHQVRPRYGSGARSCPTAAGWRFATTETDRVRNPQCLW